MQTVNVDVVVGLEPALALDGNAERKLLQLNNRANSPVTFKLDSAFIPARDAIQQVNFSRLPDGGVWRLTFDGQETADLADDISAAALKAALEALSSIGSGNVDVTGNVADGFTVEFQGNLADEPQDAMTVTANSLTDSTVEEDAVQLIAWSKPPTAGTFTVTRGADTTGALAFNISAADLKTALNALTSINGGVADVTQDVDTKAFTVTFGAPLDAQPVDLLVVDSTLTNDDDVASEVQLLACTPQPLQGSYKLMVGDQTTEELAFNDHAGMVKDALEALSNVGVGNVDVDGVNLVSGFTVTFQGALADTPIGKIEFFESTLHADTATEEPQKRVPDDVLLETVVDTPGVAVEDVTADVSTLTAGVAAADVDVTIVVTVAGNAEPSEGVTLAAMGETGDSFLYSADAPIGPVYMKASQANSPVNIIWGY